MLNNETPNEWKRKCKLFRTVVKEDKYNSETLQKGEETELSLCIQPVNDKALLEEYGISHTGSIQAVVYDFDLAIKRFDIIAYCGDEYKIKGIKSFPSYRLIIAERIDKREQKQF